jgi:hypothetical protein
MAIRDNVFDCEEKDKNYKFNNKCFWPYIIWLINVKINIRQLSNKGQGGVIKDKGFESPLQ